MKTWVFDGVDMHRGEHWYKCLICGYKDWFAYYSIPKRCPKCEEDAKMSWLREKNTPMAHGDIILAATISSHWVMARLSDTAFTIGRVLWTIDDNAGRLISETGNYVDVSPTAIMMLRAHLSKCQQYSVH